MYTPRRYWRVQFHGTWAKYGNTGMNITAARLIARLWKLYPNAAVIMVDSEAF